MESGKYNRNEEMLDDYIGYRLATENSCQHSSFNLKGIVVAVLIIIGIAMIYDALRPKCAHSGCDNTPEEGSCYCLIHDPKYYNNKNSYTPAFTTATTSRPKTTTAMVFMELLTRHATVPQERNIIPTLPITEAFSFRLAFDTGSSFSASVKSCHGISM